MEKSKFSKKFSVGIEKVTPDLAKMYLTQSPEGQRNINRRNYEAIHQAMCDNAWEASGDPIRFNDRGELIDGQHRLRALISANKTYEFVVERGLDSGAFSVIDTGAKRTPTDLLRIAGYQYTSNIASAIRVLVSLEQIIAGKMKYTSLTRIRLPPDTLLDYAENYGEELYESSRLTILGKAKQVCSPPSVFTALHFLFSRFDSRSANRFFEILITGQGFELGDSDPVYCLRNLLIEDRISKHKRRPAFYKAAVTIKAWNAFQERRKITSLRFSEGEGWPQINMRSSRIRKDVAARRDKASVAGDTTASSKKKVSKKKVSKKKVSKKKVSKKKA